jgi:hypothetical protein
MLDFGGPALTIVGGISSFGGRAMKLRMYWLDVFRELRELRLCTAGPKTSGGLIVERVKLSFALSTNSQAAFSANVLLATDPPSVTFAIR